MFAEPQTNKCVQIICWVAPIVIWVMHRKHWSTTKMPSIAQIHLKMIAIIGNWQKCTHKWQLYFMNNYYLMNN